MYANTVTHQLVRTADLVVQVSTALDAAAGAAPEHAMRTCLATMRMSEALGISDRERSSLFYAALLHEVRESGRTRDELTMQIVRRAGFAAEVVGAITAMSERWDGRGAPYGLAGEAIPFSGRLLAVCHGLDEGADAGDIQRGKRTVHSRSGSWYDPALSDVLLALCSHGLTAELTDPERYRSIRDLEPNWLARLSDADEAEHIGALAAPSIGAIA